MAIHKKFSSLRELPTIRQLRAFVAIYRSGHISAAAEMLSLTQPAITVLLRELEEKLGVRLFDRTTRSLRRTDAALEAFVYAERVLGDLEEMSANLADFAGSRRGRLQIAATSTLAQTLLPPAIQRFCAAHPNVKVGIDDCSPSEFVERIASERVTFGVGTLEAPIPGFEERVFLEDPLVAVAGSAFFSHRRALSWKQLAALPLIALKPGYGVRRSIDRAALQAGVVLRIEHEVALLSTALAMAAHDLGVAVVPGSVLAHTPFAQLNARRMVQPSVTRDTAIICKRDRSLSPAALAFIEVLVGRGGMAHRAGRDA